MIHREAQSTDSLSRRTALQIGTGLFGLSLPAFLKARAASAAATKKDISCIFVFLAGGASHFETFDPKPNAPEGIRGIWKPTATSAPGTLICEKLPLMARVMDKVAVVRSWKGRSGSHSTGSQHVMSGTYPASGKQLFPNFGCLVSALKGTKVSGIAPHVGLPVAGRYTDPPAYLGAPFAAYDIKDDPSAADFKLDDLVLPKEQFHARRELLEQVDDLGRLAETGAIPLTARDAFYNEAFATLTSGAIQRAARLGEEPRALRERYGMNVYGQRVLLARRLIEAGSRFVTINQAVQGGPYGNSKSTASGTWDNHSDIFSFLMSFEQAPGPKGAFKKWNSYKGPGNLPQLDMSLSTLIEDLDQRGLLETTLVVAMGEFGRTPKINKSGGRDHYPRAGSVLLAGAGVRGGAVIGATTADGSEPATRPYHPEDFAATIYHTLGLDPETTFYPKQSRPIRISEGTVIEGLFG